MRPFHGLHQPRPASASQFFVRQSALTYAPNGKVTVEITTHSNERHFRGFMVQAYDPANGQRIGAFAGNDVAQPMTSCSAATHRNNSDKKFVSITWFKSESAAAAYEMTTTTTTTTTESPESLEEGQQQQVSQAVNRIGSWLGLPVNGTAATRSIDKRHTTPLKQVRFRATIVVSYDEYYTGFESSELNFAKWDYSSSGTQPKAS